MSGVTRGKSKRSKRTNNARADLAGVRVAVVEECVAEVLPNHLKVPRVELPPAVRSKIGARKGGLHRKGVDNHVLFPPNYAPS